MKTIVYLPLERLDSRYTAHLDADILSYLRDNKIPYEYIDAPFKEPPPSGMFLHAAQTIQNKMHQIKQLAKFYEDGWIDSNTIIFISDLWMPGIEAIPYLNHFYKVCPEVRGIIHAGSFTPSDEVAQMGRTAQRFEEMMFNIVDKIYCGSQFIKDEIIKYYGHRYVEDKFIVTGLPLDSKLDLQRAKPYNERSNIVVFNGRNHPEKQPELWEKLKKVLGEHKYDFVWTQEEKLNKTQYYNLLCEAKVVVSFALQENFGYGIAEAVRLGCIPVVPDRLSYVEQYYKEFRYKTFDDCVNKVKFFMSGNSEYRCYQANQFSNNPIKTWFAE